MTADLRTDRQKRPGAPDGSGTGGEGSAGREMEAEIATRAEPFRRVREEIARVVVGQRTLIDRMLVCLLSNGHLLIEGPPGLAKTTAVSALAGAVRLSFRRLQFTPDLLPGDLVGTQIYNPRELSFEARKGPIFANLVLADEVNRAPAKVQSALLEAMQEQQITIGDTTHELAQPFMVMATQNPVEQEGTYPLPEAQIDRFMLHVKVGHPSRDEEKTIMTRMAQATLQGPRRRRREPVEGDGPPDPLAVQRICTPDQVLRARETIGHIIVDEKINDYIVDVVIATRDPKKAGLKDLAGMVAHGASPRASIALNLAARAHAFLRHRGYVTPDDVKAVGQDVLRHRVTLTYEADAEEVTAEQVVRRVFEVVEVP